MPKMTPPSGATTATCCSPMPVRGAGAEPLHGTAVPSRHRSAVPLDPPETSSQTRMATGDDEICDSAESFRNADSIPWEHRGWQQTRRRVYASMCRTDVATARRHRFWTCGDNVHVMRSMESGELDVYAERCHDRFCMRCGQLRSRKIAECMEALMKPAADRLMFITLTVLGRPSDSLTSMIDRLRHAWKELRRLEGWRNHIRGGR